MNKFLLFLFLLVLLSWLTFGQEEKQKSIAWEEIKAFGPDLRQIGNLKTKHSGEIKDSPRSVGCETPDRGYVKFSVYRDYGGELDVKHARLQSGWAKCEKQKGIYDFAWLDSCVYGLLDQGVKSWICLCYGNPLYNSEIELGAGIFTSEETMTAWSRYVEATVFHYKDVVKDREIWNEPRHSASPDAYANLLIKTSAAIRKSQSNATILGFTVHGFTPGIVLKFPAAVLEILKAKGKLDVVHYVMYHPYTPNPDDCYPMVEELQQLVRSYNPTEIYYPGGLYNAMIAPLQSFAIKGVIWYQGETNNNRPKQYEILFPELIKSRRNAWAEKSGISGIVPFLFVQIVPHKAMSPEIREAQLATWKSTENTAMVVTTDLGEANDIHPICKQSVGVRLALAARALAYHQRIEYSGPVWKSFVVKADKAILSFLHVGKGLVVRGVTLSTLR